LYQEDQQMSQGPSLPPSEALEKLKAGNKRFVANELSHTQRIHDARRRELIEGQSPYAAVLTCADSRTPPSHIFDAGLGDLFVCRNAGNLIDEAILGSIEYAAAHTGCPLVCVLGHDKCGAVGAAVAAAKDPVVFETPNVDDIVRRLLPAVLATRSRAADDEAWVDEAAKKNVEMVCAHITQRSPLLRAMIDRGDFMVVGGYYDLGSGQVEYIVA
jgi:carbonic anhydrase